MMEPIEVKREGIRVGLIASLSVAGFYAVFDLLAARGPFYTINLLGKAVFRGVRDPAIIQLPVPHDVAAMLLYTGFHLLLSVGIGLFVTWLIGQVERRPSDANRILLAVFAGFVATILAVGLLTAPMRPLLPWWSIVLANSLAVVCAGTYLISRHAVLRRRLFAG
jgi:hypothetical protein